MHPTADTLLVIYFQRLGRAGDAGRWAAYVESGGTYEIFDLDATAVHGAEFQPL
jgi:hypothetical protein